jgi:two-component system, NarL family, invasion response regulator UvrY
MAHLWRAADGNEAVARALELVPDLIVLDFAMDGLNGLQVAARIANALPGLPIILYTMHFVPPLITQARRVGIR